MNWRGAVAVAGVRMCLIDGVPLSLAWWRQEPSPPVAGDDPVINAARTEHRQNRCGQSGESRSAHDKQGRPLSRLGGRGVGVRATPESMAYNRVLMREQNAKDAQWNTGETRARMSRFRLVSRRASRAVGRSDGGAGVRVRLHPAAPAGRGGRGQPAGGRGRGKPGRGLCGPSNGNG